MYYSSVFAKNDGYIVEAVESGIYKCDPDGSVYSCYSRQGHKLPDGKYEKRKCSQRSGYKFIKYKGITLAVHRLVYYYFHRNLDVTKQINHIDKNPLNNSITNLELVTCSENQFHRLRKNALEKQMSFRYIRER